MDELEDIEPADFELENLKVRVEEYKTHNLSDNGEISQKVDEARLHRKDLYEKYLELLDMFSIADDFCQV